MRALTGIVIALGIMIVTVTVMIGYGFYKKSIDPDWHFLDRNVPKETEATAKAPTRPAKTTAFGDINLGLATGCHIRDITAEGTLAYLTIGPDGTCDAVIVVDVSRGQILGRISGRIAPP